ncbi:MAG: bifunctional (p)ppGpp synthetase/guanosine-3',5'-bis(diphosphate) 3'-pyrophosphohydrolase [Myxococcales bacterium]|nr:bifunctional (p)ppGpp synthetase/guanosine-3',5'-bis(diphosphate) 3'-pyrophosphohydrolase [Myxococcales bacterium]
MLPLPELVSKVRAYHPQADVELIEKAYRYSERMHEGQKRKSGDPYFIHPTHVAGIITELRLDTSSLCAALLHDVVEDTDVTEKDIAQQFGEEVAFLVDGVTKLGKVNFASKEDRQAESFRKMLIAMARDIRVLLVKLADRLDNMRTLEHMNVDSQERIASETMEIYAPLAGRLGIHWIKAELEDLAFQYLHPDASEDLRRKVGETSIETDRYVDEVTTQLLKMLVSRGFALDVSGRQKHLYSIHKKMRRQGIEFEQVQDQVAFRCIMETVADCYAALGVVHSEWTPIPGRFKDYIALPKPNMYQSLHTTVIGPRGRRIEVQIRTHEMHRTAELGIAAHWKYKERSAGLERRDAERFAWLRQLMEWQKELEDPTEFLESVKVDLFPEDVYVFTPKGDVKTFPRDATPIDFAYSIHSEVGSHCTGARVNGVMVPLRHKLRNGDVVEILTSKNQQPSKDWLDFVVTGRARSRIRTHFRTKERARSMKLGRDLLERALHKHNLSFSRWLKTGEVKKTLEELGLQSEEDLFAHIGYGKVDVSKVLDIADPKEPESKKQLAPSFFEKTVRKVTRKDADATIRIDGLDDVLVRFGKCCTPVPGDPVVGWITRGRGVTIHRRGCPRSMELDPQRRIEVSWSSDTKMELPVSLRVTTNNSPGILSKVSSVFTENGLNINEAICRTQDDGRAVNTFLFTVDDLARLRNVMRGIAKITGVQDVERV